MDRYAGYDHTDNFKHGHEDYVAQYPQFWGGKEQQYYTLNGRKCIYQSWKHRNGSQYPDSSVFRDVERSSGYGLGVPSDEQCPYSLEQNKAHQVWITRGISD